MPKTKNPYIHNTIMEEKDQEIGCNIFRQTEENMNHRKMLNSLV